jgi:hypothetical protein
MSIFYYSIVITVVAEMMIFLLEEIKKYSPTSSLLVVNLNSIERRDSAFLVLFLQLSVVSGFNCLLNVH